MNENKTNTTTNNSTMLEMMLGPVRDPLETVVPMSVLYSLLLFTGTIGNVCTCVVIAKNRYMHTATNFYLFSLAISDLLLLILGLPQELFMLWQKYPYIFGEFWCLVRGLSSETSTNASVLTITAFTVERYVAICHPLKSHTMSQLPRATKIILVIWVISAVCALLVSWQFGIIFMINKSPLKDLSRICGLKTVYFEYGFEMTAIFFFVIPITLIIVLYILIGINLRQSSHQTKEEKRKPNIENNNGNNSVIATEASSSSCTNGNNNKTMKELSSSANYSEPECINLYERHNSVSSSHQKQMASRRSVVRMLIAVVIAFFFCYSPFHAQRVLATSMHRYKIQSTSIHNVYNVLTHISGVTYYLSATINPILYQVMSRKFRIAFRDTFGSCFPCLRNDLPEITYYNTVGGAGGCYLSRVPSYNSNCSYRRSSSFNVENERRNSMKMVHSFDPICDDRKRPSVDFDIRDESINTNNLDLIQDNQINKIEDADVVIIDKSLGSKQFKQFLDVPSVKF